MEKILATLPDVVQETYLCRMLKLVLVGFGLTIRHPTGPFLTYNKLTAISHQPMKNGSTAREKSGQALPFCLRLLGTLHLLLCTPYLATNEQFIWLCVAFFSADRISRFRTSPAIKNLIILINRVNFSALAGAGVSPNRCLLGKINF